MFRFGEGICLRMWKSICLPNFDEISQSTAEIKLLPPISPIWGEAPTVPIKTIICMAGNLADLITCAKFQDEIFRGYDFTQVRISHFPIDFRMGSAARLRCL